ncbi:MAG: peroxiredoxin [Limnochordaceae bacterium]|nr:peroxiredoxin [Limnochordaceae bacterium]
MDSVRLGDRVPDLQLPAYFPTTGEEGIVRLADYRGRWLVLVFYPADFTFVCPTELADYGELYDEFRQRNAEVVGISTDTVYTHKAWLEAEKTLEHVRYPMASDRTGHVARLFGVLDETSGNARRGTFILDPEGRVRDVEVTWDNVGRNASETLRRLDALIFVDAHPGMACPAKWTKGARSLRTGVAVAGRVYQELHANGR